MDGQLLICWLTRFPNDGSDTKLPYNVAAGSTVRSESRHASMWPVSAIGCLVTFLSASYR